MIAEPFQKFGKLFDECLNEFPNDSENNFFQKKWTSEVKDGKFRRLIQKSILNQKLCREKFEKSKIFYDLKIEFFKIPLISDSEINTDSLLDEFIETYFYFSQKTKFEQNTFSHSCEILSKHILEEYFKKFYFFTPLYNFDTDFESIEIDEFKILKNSSALFDRIASIDLYDSEKEPLVDFPIKQSKYVLSFYTKSESGERVNPKEISSKFLSALRITTSGSINFGQFYLFHPLGWQGTYLPSFKENQKYSGKKYYLKQEELNFLKVKFQLLKKLHDNFGMDSTRYLTYSIRRFDYIYRDGLVEDNITDLMITLETMLNYQPYEVSDKTSLRAAMILEEDDQKKRDCQKFIKKCYDIRSEIIHGKKRKAKIKEIKEVLSDIEINKILSNEKIKKILTQEEINKIHSKEFKKILSKEEINEVLPDEFKKILDDNEIKNRLESYVRKAISQVLFLHLKYETQEKILNKIDLFTLNRSENLFD